MIVTAEHNQQTTLNSSAGLQMSELVAYHEAGHVLLAVLLGGRVRSVTIEPDRDDGPERYGDTQILWPRGRWTAREQAEKDVQVALAGPVAEMIHTGDPFHPGLVAEWAADWQVAWESAALLIDNEAQRLRHLEQLSLRLHRQLSRDDYWAALAAIVDHLLAHETLEGEQVEEILAAWLS